MTSSQLAAREGYATPKEVADFLGTSEGALAQWRYRGIGPAFIKLSPRSVRYDWADVQQYVENRRQGGDAA